LKPSSYSKNIGEKIAQLEIEDFTVYELNVKGVKSVLSGTVGRQFSTYYEVENAHYVENKTKLSEHLYADIGRFENDIAYLDENVRYFREDGLSFESDHAVYSTKKESLHIPKSFILTHNENIIYGQELHYDAVSGKISAQKVDANYYLEDKK
jgi:hypothetical protein